MEPAFIVAAAPGEARVLAVGPASERSGMVCSLAAWTRLRQASPQPQRRGSAARFLCCDAPQPPRREFLQRLTAAIAAGVFAFAPAEEASAKVEPMPALEGRGFGKERTKYADFSQTESGLQFRDVRDGKGSPPQDGDRVVMNWEGYTIGYYGRIFQAKNRTKGGAFENDQDFYRFVLGEHKVIPALEEAVRTMKPGGVRQVVIPSELGYPSSDPQHEKIGPKPTSFSGERALNFVLFNKGLIDKTLLINVELLRVDRPGERNFKKQ